MSPAGTVELRGLRVLASLGVEESERAAPQPLELDVDVQFDMTQALRSDVVDDTVDYGSVVAEIKSVVEGSSFRLLESLADAVCGAVLAHGSVLEVTVVVRKLRPPVPADLASAGVRLTRSRG